MRKLSRLRGSEWRVHKFGRSLISVAPSQALVVTASNDNPGPRLHDAVRVLLADDHAFYRDGLAQILASEDFDVVAQVPNGEAAVEAAVELAPDVVVMDLNMPTISGVEATRQVRARAPACRVVVLTVSAEEEDVIDAIVAGANGYVLKDGPVEEVAAAIRAVAAGQSLITPRVASSLLGRIRTEPQGDPVSAGVDLSAREIDVLALLADGKPNAEIGELLYISPSTVRNHISSILMKLHVENRVQAAVRAVRDRIL
jgi:DNA-binding NarL/FixJ family response regulator